MKAFHRMTPAEQAEVRRSMLPERVLGLIAAGIFFTIPFFMLLYFGG